MQADGLSEEDLTMATNDDHLLLRSNLKQLRLPTMQAEFQKLAREATAAGEGHEQYCMKGMAPTYNVPNMSAR